MCGRIREGGSDGLEFRNHQSAQRSTSWPQILDDTYRTWACGRVVSPGGVWSLRVTAEHDPEVADLFRIRLWAEIAGTRIGLGDYRPRRGGLFGRFEAKLTELGFEMMIWARVALPTATTGVVRIP